MNKEQINEKQLLADATSWFEERYAKTPKECGVYFIKVWHKPTPLRKTITVVFAPTEEIGKAFIREQNILFYILRNLWLICITISVSVVAFLYCCSRTDDTGRLLVAVIFAIFFVGVIGFFLYMEKKCKKLEKIHKWNVEVYYPSL